MLLENRLKAEKLQGMMKSGKIRRAAGRDGPERGERPVMLETVFAESGIAHAGGRQWKGLSN
jgi:hypothetical protein